MSEPNQLQQANQHAMRARMMIAVLICELLKNTPQRHTDSELCSLVKQLSEAHAALWIINIA